MLNFPIGLPPSLVHFFGAFGESTHGLHGDEEYRNSFWVLNGITKGAGSLDIGGEIHAFREKSVILVPPDIPHRYHFDSPVIKTWAHFRVAGTDQTAPIAEVQYLGDRYDWYRTTILGCRGWVLAEPERSMATLWYLLWQLTAGPSGGTGPRHHPLIQSLVRYLEINLQKPFCVGMLAAELGTSPAHLNRLCHAAFGLSTAAFVRRIRLERAIHLLSHTTESISSIAQTIGCPDLQHFNKLVRSFTGRSPRQLRRG